MSHEPLSASRTRRTLSDAVADLQTELNRIDRAAAAAHGVGGAEELQLLRLIERSGPQRVGRLAAGRAASVATVSARIDRLERKGFVTRQRDPLDRRAVVVELTETGRTVARTSARDRRRLLRGLDTDAVRVVDQVVDALRAG